MEPMLRFKADDGSEFPAWEEKMFGDVFANLTNNTLSRECLNAESGQARNIHYGDVLVKYGAVVDVQRDGVPFVNPDVECKRWDCLKDGDVVIADTAEDETVGKAVEISNAGSDIVYSGLHTIACRPKEEFAPGYLGNYINSMSYHDQLRPYMQGIKVTSVSKTNIGLTHLLVPSLPEQHKIADLLSAVDDVISAQEAEVAAWEKRKKGVMQKLFSQEVRFKADDGSNFPDWEEKTLGEICEQLKASIDPRNNPTKQFIEYSMPAYDNHMAAQAVLGQSMNSARKILSAPCVLINKLNVRKRRIWVVEHPEDNAMCSSEFVPLTSAEFDLRFLGYLAMTDSFTGYLLDCSSGSSNSQKRVTPDTILQYLVSLPSLPEQRKIADCLTSLDDVIAKAKDELDAWRELKKGLLQQMFV